MELRQLRSFDEVARRGSLSAAVGARPDLAIRALDPADSITRQVFTAIASGQHHQPAITAVLSSLARASAQVQSRIGHLVARHPHGSSPHGSS